MDKVFVASGRSKEGLLLCYDCGDPATRIDLQQNSEHPEIKTQFVWCETCFQANTT